MKIAMITTCQHPCSPETGWGSENYVWDLVDCLDQLGHEVTIFGKEGSKCPEHGHLIICRDENEIKTLYNPQGFDITHDFSATKQIHDFCQEHGLKSIVTNFNIHYLYPRNSHNNMVCVSECQKRLGLLGMSGFEGTKWQEQVGYTGTLRNENAKVVYLGIDLNKYTPKYNKENYILFFNSFDYRKGITTAINLAAEMGFNLIIAGEMKGHPEHQWTFQNLKLLMDSIPNIKYLCDVTNEQKIELMQNAKALLFPSMFHQPFGVVVTQAMACGTPVIISNHGAFPEQVIHTKTGFLCNNLKQIKEAIQNIHEIDGRDCREDAEQRFDRMTMTKNYLKLYKDIIDGKGW